MFSTLADIKDYNSFSDASRALLGNGAFEELEDDMVSANVIFSRGDRWGKDKVSRVTRTPHSMDVALSALPNEPETQRVLHVLQIMQANVPVLASDIERFLSRVTFL